MNNHRCNSRFLRFCYSGHVFYVFKRFFLIFSTFFYLKKTLSNATAKYLTYLLKITEVIQIWEFDNLHMTQCAKRFFLNFLHVFYVL